MNARLTSHIGSTLAQRAIARYRMEQRGLDAERERFERTAAALQVDALLARIREHDASGCAECEDEAKPVPLWLLALGATLWTALLLIGLALMAIRRGWLA
ncbi:MAG: hypothetical protein WA777_19980 [Rhodanobacter sp.]